MKFNAIGHDVEISCSLSQLKKIYVALFKQIHQQTETSFDIDEDDTLIDIQKFLQKLAKDSGVDATIHADWEAFLGIKDPVCRTQKVWPPLKNGTNVITTELNKDLACEWTELGLAKKKWGMKGQIINFHDSHGLCYDIKHEDGSVGCYDPSEFKVI